MPIMKEFLAILLVLGMLLSLVCCANADNDGLHIGFTDVCSTGDPEHWMVKKEDGVYYALDIAGKTLTYSGEWDWLDSFGDGLALVEKNGKWGYINTSGELAISCEWDVASSFSEGLARVQKDDKCGYINTSGEVVIPLEWAVANNFIDGLALVEKDGKYGYISATGEAVIPLEWDDAYDFGNGLAYVEKDGKYGYVTTSGKYFEFADSCDGYIAGINDGYLTVYDPNGNIIF